MTSRFAKARKYLLFWCIFIGVGAVAGTTGMLVAPDGSAMGMQSMLPYFQVLPFADVLFQNYVFPGVALLCVNGLPNLLAAWLLLRKRRAGVVLGAVLGVTLMLWICIQFIIFPINFLSTIYFIFGLAQAATGYAALVFQKQERFTVREEDYPNVGSNHRELVVYFSRMGYVKKLALETAERSGADLCELRATERTAGTSGFWWCGRYGLHRWDMPILPVEAELSAYDRVTICTPIWVFAAAAPVRTFCRQSRGRIKSADYVLVHNQRLYYQRAVKDLDSLLGLTHGSVRSVSCKTGVFREIAAPKI